MKWNWGKGIALSFVLFCGFVITIVVMAFQQNIDLVSETYYQDELVYQDRIDERSNLNASGMGIEIKQESDHLVLGFPSAFGDAKGEIKFYHPSRAIFDQTHKIKLDDGNKQIVSKSKLIKGNFKVQVSWESAGKKYYEEQQIFLR
ncbi:MAG: FixH family protein [Cyclobacteriaceae bacterium]